MHERCVGYPLLRGDRFKGEIVVPEKLLEFLGPILNICEDRFGEDGDFGSVNSTRRVLIRIMAGRYDYRLGGLSELI